MNPEEFARLSRIARAQGVSVAELFRRAVRERYLRDPEEKSSAFGELLATELDVTFGEWDELRDEIEAARAPRLP